MKSSSKRTCSSSHPRVEERKRCFGGRRRRKSNSLETSVSTYTSPLSCTPPSRYDIYKTIRQVVYDQASLMLIFVRNGHMLSHLVICTDRQLDLRSVPPLPPSIVQPPSERRQPFCLSRTLTVAGFNFFRGTDGWRPAISIARPGIQEARHSNTLLARNELLEVDKVSSAWRAPSWAVMSGS